MPLRSPKMNRFIFGFQRRVWCPKWTPASSSCFMVTTGAIWFSPSLRFDEARALAPGGDRGNGTGELVCGPWWSRPTGECTGDDPAAPPVSQAHAAF